MWAYRHRIVAALAAVFISVGAATAANADPEPGSSPTTSRLSGPSRYDTSAAIAATVPAYRAFHQGSLKRTVRLVSGARPLDLATSAEDSSPTLLIPPSGPMPAKVLSTYRALRPQHIIVVGAASVLSDAQVRRLVGRSGFERLLGDPTTLSVRSAVEAQTPGSDDDTVLMNKTMFMPAEPLASVAGAAQQRRQPVVLSRSGPIAPAWDRLSHMAWWDGPFVAYGGAAGLPDSRVRRLITALGEEPQFRVSTEKFERAGGRDRYETNAMLAEEAFPANTHVVYLAEGARGVDAAAGVSLPEGPVLLVPPCGELPASVRDRLDTWRPSRIVALGGAGAVCDDILRQAAAATTAAPQQVATDLVGGSYGPSGHCALTSSEQVWCWYDPLASQPTPTAPRRVPLSQPVRDLAGSPDGATACAIDRLGAVRCWAVNPARTEGVANSADPTPVGGLHADVASLSVGTKHGCAVKTDGSVWCWGKNDERQLGDGTTTSRTDARPVPGVADVVQVAVGKDMSCALDARGQLTCWGSWYQGEIGKGGAYTAKPPTRQQLPAANVTSLSIAFFGVHVITDDGRYFWVEENWPTDEPGSPRWSAPMPATRLLLSSPGCAQQPGGAVICDGKIIDVPALGSTARRLAGLAGGQYGACARYDDGGIVCSGSAGSGAMPDWGPSIPVGFTRGAR